MNILIMIDAEGLGGIYNDEQVSWNSPHFLECRRYMTSQLNSLAHGLKLAGADKIFARDCHGIASCLIWDEISDDVDRIIMGDTANVRLPHIEEADAVILMGYHAKAGTQKALLEHTMTSASWQRLLINGKESGEILLDASIAGDYNKPVILVTGDDYACAEAKENIKGVVTAQVKSAASCFGASMLPKGKVHTLLIEKAAEAIAAYKNIFPVVQPKPVTLQLELTERHQLPNSYSKPYMRVVGDRTYEVTGDSVLEALYRLF